MIKITDLYLKIMQQESGFYVFYYKPSFSTKFFRCVLVYISRGGRTIVRRKTQYIAKLYFCDYRWEESTL